jgi:hypothetical protein
MAVSAVAYFPLIFPLLTLPRLWPELLDDLPGGPPALVRADFVFVDLEMTGIISREAKVAKAKMKAMTSGYGFLHRGTDTVSCRLGM